MSPHLVTLLRPGTVEYIRAWRWQQAAAAALRDGAGHEALVLLQHPPVYTLGRRARLEHLLLRPEALRGVGAGVVETDRGGDVTFHGPGQVVGYPILDLRRRGIGPVEYVRSLEQTMIDAIGAFGVTCERVPGRPGVWAGPGKVGAVGVRVQGGVTTHGFALNVSTDAQWFEAIVPCGLRDAVVTSLALLLGRGPAIGDVEDALADAFERVFDVTLIPGDPSWAAYGAPAALCAEVSGHDR